MIFLKPTCAPADARPIYDPARPPPPYGQLHVHHPPPSTARHTLQRQRHSLHRHAAVHLSLRERKLQEEGDCWPALLHLSHVRPRGMQQQRIEQGNILQSAWRRRAGVGCSEQCSASIPSNLGARAVLEMQGENGILRLQRSSQHDESTRKRSEGYSRPKQDYQRHAACGCRRSPSPPAKRGHQQ